MKAERETADRLIAHHLADRIGASFQGRISGVTRAGLFVKLDDTGADGLVPIRTLGTEYFNYDEARHALVGSRSGAMHRLGDVVDVRLVEAAPDRRRAAVRTADRRPRPVPRSAGQGSKPKLSNRKLKATKPGRRAVGKPGRAKDRKPDKQKPQSRASRRKASHGRR